MLAAALKEQAMVVPAPSVQVYTVPSTKVFWKGMPELTVSKHANA